MRLTCPACQAEMSLDAAIGREVDGRALATFIAANVPLGAQLVNYIALFRPAKRRLSLARVVNLFEELQPDLQRGVINRKGRDWVAPAEVWRTAIEQVLAARDKGTLTLPLTSHGYLYEVIVGHADKAEAVAERVQIDTARQRNGASTSAPVAVQQALAASGKPVPYDPAKGPSRAAREAKARMQNSLAARSEAPTSDDQPEGLQP